jgi:hypothetical protein
MIRIQIAILLLLTIICLFFRLNSIHEEHCITIFNSERCFYFCSNDIDTLKTLKHNYIKYQIESDDEIGFLSDYSEMYKSLLQQDSTRIIEILLTNSNYNQFIKILDLCLKSNVHYLILNLNDQKAFLMIGNNPKYTVRPFSGCYYSINQDSISLNFPPEK